MGVSNLRIQFDFEWPPLLSSYVAYEDLIQPRKGHVIVTLVDKVGAKIPTSSSIYMYNSCILYLTCSVVPMFTLVQCSMILIHSHVSNFLTLEDFYYIANI
jgi:hypothetical protein